MFVSSMGFFKALWACKLNQLNSYMGSMLHENCKQLQFSVSEMIPFGYLGTSQLLNLPLNFGKLWFSIPSPCKLGLCFKLRDEGAVSWLLTSLSVLSILVPLVFVLVISIEQLICGFVN